jgi:hypothetical protein
VELAFVLPLLLLLFFGLIDFGRLAFHWVGAEKASAVAARIAAVRPPACSGLPETYERGSNISVRFGADCRAGAGICAVPPTVSCAGSLENETSVEIWRRIAPLLPNDATIANLRFTYSATAGDSASQIGFLGGPYVPTVTVELEGLKFRFATPLSGLADLARGAAGSTISNTIAIPAMSVSMPGEDLALGADG